MGKSKKREKQERRKVGNGKFAKPKPVLDSPTPANSYSEKMCKNVKNDDFRPKNKTAESEFDFVTLQVNNTYLSMNSGQKRNLELLQEQNP